MKAPHWTIRYLPCWLILTFGWLGDLIMLGTMLVLFLPAVQRIVG